MDPKRFGVVAVYITGSVNEWSAGPASDIDIIIHFRGTTKQREDLCAWLDEWSRKLDNENNDRTGYVTGGLLDVHLITDQDIDEKSSWAAHLDPLYGTAKKLELPKIK